MLYSLYSTQSVIIMTCGELLEVISLRRILILLAPYLLCPGLIAYGLDVNYPTLKGGACA